MKSPLNAYLGVAVLFIFSFCMVTWAITPSRSYENPKLVSGTLHIRSACMMPTEGKLSKVGVKGGEGMSQESDTWSITLQTIVENHLKSAGVQLLPASSALDSGASDDELRQTLLAVQQKYQSVAPEINKKPKDIRTGRFTLGDSVSLLPCSAKSDVLIFAEGQGDVLTGGKKAMGLLVPGPKSSTASLLLTIVDAKTGEVLAFVNMWNNGKFVDDSEKAFGHALDEQFRKIGVGTIADNPKH